MLNDDHAMYSPLDLADVPYDRLMTLEDDEPPMTTLDTIAAAIAPLNLPTYRQGDVLFVNGDMPEVLRIEQLCHAWPWTEATFIGHLKNRNTIAMVCDEDEIAGFAVYELNKSFLEIINIAVHPFAQRRDVGTALIAKLAAKIQYRRDKLVAHVWENNSEAQLFFHAVCVECVDIARGYFLDEQGSEQDAYRFELTRAAARKLLREVGDGVRFQRVLGGVVGKRLTYRVLTNQDDAGFMGIQ